MRGVSGSLNLVTLWKLPIFSINNVFLNLRECNVRMKVKVAEQVIKVRERKQKTKSEASSQV